MSSKSHTTTNHHSIRAWAESHDAVPATARGTQADHEPGVLTLDVLGYGAGEDRLEHIDWDTWFEKFEEADLAFVYQEEKTSGSDSTFFRLVDRESVSG